MWFPIVNARFWLFDSKGGTKILTKTPSLRWKLNKTLRSEHGCVASVFRKWLREAKSLLFTLFGVSPVSCSVFGKCAVCVWFIKLLTVIYATFVHTIITGISEFFFCSTPTPESRAWILFINHSRYHFNEEKKHIYNPRIQDAYQFIIEPIHWKWCIHTPKKTRSKTRSYHRNGKLIKFTARKVNWTTQQKRIDDSAWPCQCKGKYIRALVFNFPFLYRFFPRHCRHLRGILFAFK